MSKAGQQILYMESGGEKYVKLGDYLKLLREISNLAEAGSELTEGSDLRAADSSQVEAMNTSQIRDFLLTTYTEYLIGDFTHLKRGEQPTFQGYINYLRSL